MNVLFVILALHALIFLGPWLVGKVQQHRLSPRSGPAVDVEPSSIRDGGTHIFMVALCIFLYRTGSPWWALSMAIGWSATIALSIVDRRHSITRIEDTFGRIRARTTLPGIEHVVAAHTGRATMTTGDAEFDAAVRVDGSPIQALATLDAERRALIRNLIARGCRIETVHNPTGSSDQTISLALPASAIWSSHALHRRADEVVALAELLSRRGMPSADLADDPVPGVRLRWTAIALEHLGEPWADATIARGWERAGVQPDDALALLGTVPSERAVRDLLVVDHAGTCGDLGAMRHLATLDHPEPLVQQARDRAIVAMQQRFGGTDGGTLTLAEPLHDGGLSAAADTGQLTLQPSKHPR